MRPVGVLSSSGQAGLTIIHDVRLNYNQPKSVAGLSSDVNLKVLQVSVENLNVINAAGI